MKNAAIQAHVRAINNCNQRGGRMLSLVDLIDAGTIDLPLAAYLAAAMRSGASLLVGARPGGAGKTAVMCALLNFLPDQTSIRAIDSSSVLAEGRRDEQTGQTCYLAHEISPATYYYAYLWGQPAQTFFRLAEQGHIIASNLHADTLAETEDQLCRENGVARTDLEAVTLKLSLHLERTGGWRVRRRINRVYESDGSSDRLLWDNFVRRQDSAVVSPEEEKIYAEFLERLVRRDVRDIEEVRRILVEG